MANDIPNNSTAFLIGTELISRIFNTCFGAYHGTQYYYIHIPYISAAY